MTPWPLNDAVNEMNLAESALLEMPNKIDLAREIVKLRFKIKDLEGIIETLADEVNRDPNEEEPEQPPIIL